MSQYLAIKRSIITGLFLISAVSFTATAQQTIKIKTTPLSFNIHPQHSNPYHAFNYPLSKTIDYSNYPLTAGEILKKKRGIELFNAVTNYNRNGFMNNYLGITRPQPVHPRPGF